MAAQHLTLSVLPDLFAICRLSPDVPVPTWADRGPFAAIVRTRDELSIVCLQAVMPAGVQAEVDWRCLKVDGPFALDGTIGVLAALAAPLAEAQVSIFVVSTYDTDYLLVKDKQVTPAIEALSGAGYRVQT